MIPYLSSSFLFTEINGEGQVHCSEHRIRLTSLGVADELPQALIHDRVEEGKVMPVNLQDGRLQAKFIPRASIVYKMSIFLFYFF